MRVTILGPNLRDQSRGDMHVHAEGCADIVRNVRAEPEYENGWTIEASTRTEVCDVIYPPEDFQCESGEYLNTICFFPCCASLPTT